MAKGRTADFYITIMTGGLTLFLGYIAMNSLYENSNGSDFNRQPASTQGSAILKQVVASDTPIIAWDCIESALRIPRAAKRVRLTLNHCKGETVSTVLNQTNGYTATLFHLRKGLTTDYLDLEEGSNEVRVGLKSQKTQELREVKISLVR